MLPTEDQERARANRANSAVGAQAKTDGAAISFDQPTRAVWVGGTGTLECTFVDSSTATLSGIPDGTLLPISVSAITGGTATDVVGLF